MKAIIVKESNKDTINCSYDNAQYKSEIDQSKYCINEDNKIIRYRKSSNDGTILQETVSTSLGEQETFKDNYYNMQKRNIENDKLVIYTCKVEGLSVCEFNREVKAYKIFLGYKCNASDGLANVKCTYFWRNGDKYEGDWIDGKKNGKGTLTFSDGDKYEG